MNDATRTALGRIEDRTAKVVVIGQGYVGLPVAMRASEVGFAVVGFEVSAERVAALRRRRELRRRRLRRRTAPARSPPATGRRRTQPTSPASTSP